jgi:hypothetical protein
VNAKRAAIAARFAIFVDATARPRVRARDGALC